MSIGNLICDSVFLLGLRRYESAMCLALNALDATAQKEYPELAGKRHVGERCTRFVRDHYDIISVVGTGGAIFSAPGSSMGVNGPGSGTPQSLEDVLYKLVQCGLTHEAQLPSNTYFNEQSVFGETPQGLSIPVHMVYAVILAVLGAGKNATEITVDGTPELIVMGRTIPLAASWGQKAAILQTIGVSVTSGLEAGGSVPAIGTNHGTLINCHIVGPNAIAVNKGTLSGCVFDARRETAT